MRKPVIDGNHRAARALRDRHEFFAFVLGESETLELLRSNQIDLAISLKPKHEPQFTRIVSRTVKES